SIETVAVTSGKKLRMGAGGVHFGIQIEEDDIVAWIGDSQNIEFFAQEMGLDVQSKLTVLADALSQNHSGFAELIIPPTSPWVDESPISIYSRRDYGLPIVAVVRDGDTITDRETVDNITFKAGDTVIAYTDWRSLYRLDVVQNIVVVTSDYPHEEVRSEKIPHAVAILAVTLALVLFTDLRLSVSLLAGALGMIITNIISAEEAYYAVSWKTVFLLASLIPLGAAVESSGTAAWIADQILSAIGETSIWVLQLTVAALATLFTLVMSNVGATVLLVPLAINIALSAGADPMVFALTVALATSNSFLIPTHQVNALIMGPGGYGVLDFIRAGGIMTILFLAVLMVTMNLFY
ncbi:MAG: SLC13 family permease, partial [Desulfobacterales bacterium]|nr:SLC13 family permease [Desulfobacterales bacterium]